MPYDLVPDARALADAARGFARYVAAPHAARCERERTHDRALFREAAALGLTAVQTPRQMGGLGLPFAARAAVAEALGEACWGVAMAVINTHNAAFRLARMAGGDLRGRLLPGLLSGELVGCTAMTEPHAGSDFAALRTTARRDGDGWRLDGEKAWVVNAAHADVIVVFAQTGEIGDAKGVAGFVVETAREGARVATGGGFAGLHAMGLGGLVLEGYRAPEEALSLPPGGAFRQALEDVNGARAHVAAMCCGMLESALAEATAYGRERHAFGKPLAAHQDWRRTLARAEADLAAARLTVREAARAIDAGEDAQLPAATAKLVAVETAARHLPAAAHAMGAAGLGEDSRMARHLLGVRGAALADGSTEMLLERVARLSRSV